MEEHSSTHSPYRASCLAMCCAGLCRASEGQQKRRIPDIMYHYVFLRAEGGQGSHGHSGHQRLAHSHVVRAKAPRNGVPHEHGGRELLKYLQKVGCLEVILKCDGAPVLRCIHKEVMRLREWPMTQACGTARPVERQSVSLRGRVLRPGLLSTCPVWQCNHQASMRSDTRTRTREGLPLDIVFDVLNTPPHTGSRARPGSGIGTAWPGWGGYTDMGIPTPTQ